MNLLQLIDGKKAYIAGAGLLLIALGQLLTHAGHCITLHIDVQSCVEQFPALWDALREALTGLGIIGVRHALAKAA